MKATEGASLILPSLPPPSLHPTAPLSAPRVSGSRLNDSWRVYGLGFGYSVKIKV